ncbi:MAG TPA: hypothetical protein VFU73_11340 [Actinocrinis sp.]|nr:hypothetical protein [Actinocrinis sp.]
MMTAPAGTARSNTRHAGGLPSTTTARREPNIQLNSWAGATASLRRLAFAVTGVADDLAPTTLIEALEVRTRTARDAGYPAAAAAFDAAGRYLVRAFEASPAAGRDPEATDRQRLVIAAVRQVHRAHTLLRGTDIGLLRPPADPPDPGLITHPAALIDDLRALHAWSGRPVDALAIAGRRRGLHTGEIQLLATLDSRRFPTPTTLEAIVAGCGLSEQRCAAWLAARHRAARALPPGRRAGPGTARHGPAVRVAVDPERAETPAQLTALLIELKESCETSDSRILHAAQLAGCAVSWSRLWAVSARYEFPTPRILEAFLIGCGLDAPEREPWMLARKRLAADRRHAGYQDRREAAARSTRRSPLRPPDPCRARTWAQFSAALRALIRWSGRDLSQIAWVAMSNGIPVTTDALHYAVAYNALPTPSTLDALVVGCGLSRPQRFGWRMVRARLATLPERTQRLPATVSAQGHR